MKKWGFILAILMFVCSFSYGTTITVPGDYGTIKEAVEAETTLDGDIVVVSIGTYDESDIDMGGKAIMLTSTDPNDPAVVAQTIIDGGGSGRAITCNSGEDADTVITGFRIQNGDASNGGGIYCYQASPTISNCVFSDNDGGSFGGAIFCYSNANSTISNCTFIGNIATSQGGGVSCYLASPTLRNCVFSGNASTSYGGGLACYKSTPTLYNCTFSRNSAVWGGGLYSHDNSDPVVVNCIFWDDSASTGPEIYYSSGNAPVVRYTVAAGCGGSGAEWNSSFGIDDGNNLDADPNFLDADGVDNVAGTDDDDLHLDAFSICINAGDPSGNYAGQLDLDLISRVRYDSVDIGADEVFYVGADLSMDDLDEQVGVEDILLFADLWLTDVDFNDFVLFSRQWLYGAE